MTRLDQARPFSEPTVDAENRHYFEAASQGRLALKRCDDCGRAHHYPRTLCPFCMSSRTHWFDAVGAGTIYSFTVTRRGGPFPYALAYVRLQEGPTMLTNIVQCDSDALRIGLPVRVAFLTSESGAAVPAFAPG